ncbi:MAG: hypothetical protein IT193_09410 [Propionibacteriaceae bacterium]|nr:hypothetical protein [Propionibacteriaceae bacterium]
MLSALVAILAAVLVVAVLMLGRRRSRSPALAATPGWVAFGAGTLGFLALAIPVVNSWLAGGGAGTVGVAAPWLPPASITLGLVGLATGIYAIRDHDRSWRTWVGLVAGGLVTAFWAAFAIAEALYPH